MTISARLKLSSFVVSLACLFTDPALGQANSQQNSDIERTGLPEALISTMRQAKVPTEALFVSVLPATKTNIGQTLSSWQWQGSQAMQPGSIIKPLIASLALERLGPAWRGQVEVLSDGLIDRLRQTPARPDIGLQPFDEAPEWRYNMIPDALSMNMNLLPLRFKSDDKSVDISIPYDGGIRLPALKLVSEIKVTNQPCGGRISDWKVPSVEVNGQIGEAPFHLSEVIPTTAQSPITIRFKGNFPRQCSQELELNLLDRTQFLDRWFRAFWNKHGGQFRGEVRELKKEETVSNSLKLVARHQSRPLAELIWDVNKRSDNPTTRLIWMAIGEMERSLKAPSNDAAIQPMSTQELAQVSTRRWLDEIGLDTQSFVIDNGSGLSRSERISTALLAQVLAKAYSGRWAPEFLASLPIIGLDGSMQNRLKEGPAAMNGRIKTGGLRNVHSIAGYVTDQQGQTWVVVASINIDRANGPENRKILDQIIEWVARGQP